MVRNSRAGLGLIVGLALATAAPSAQDAATVIGGASKALGVDSLKTVQYAATGFDFALGQAPNPSSPWPKFINTSYTRAVDFEKGMSKVDRVRVQGENPPHGGGQQPIVGEQRRPDDRVNASTPWARSRDRDAAARLPRAAAANHATVEPKTIGGKKYRGLVCREEQGQGQRISQRAESRGASRRPGSTTRSSATCRSRRSTTDYKDVGGALFPMHIVQKPGGYRSST
jgi:hypothetical protein